MPILRGVFPVCLPLALDALPRNIQLATQALLGVRHSKLIIFPFASYAFYLYSLFEFIFPYIITELEVYSCRLAPIPIGVHDFDKAIRWRLGISCFSNVLSSDSFT